MNRIVCLSAVWVLVAVGVAAARDPSPEEIRLLVQKLEQSSGDERLEVAAFLARNSVEADRVLPVLREALSHEGGRQRMRAAEALMHLGPVARAAAPRLSEMLHGDADPEARAAAGYALATIGADADAVVAELLKVVLSQQGKDGSRGMARVYAGNAIATLGARAVPAIRAGLQQDELREPALQMLQSLGDAAAPLVPEMVQYLKEGALDGVRGGRLLARHGRPAAARVVALLKEDDAIASRAVSVLCEFGDEAIPDLAVALDEKRPDVRQRAGEILYYQSLHQRFSVKPEVAGSIIPGLARLAGDADVDVRRRAVITLCRLGEAGAPEVLRALRDRDVRIRLAACEALGNLGTQVPDTVRLPLAECLADADPLVRVEAADALRTLQPDSPRIVPVLLAGLWDDRGDVRHRALTVVYQMRDEAHFAEAALPHLRWFDPDRRVRRLASRMMRKMEEEGRQ